MHCLHVSFDSVPGPGPVGRVTCHGSPASLRFLAERQPVGANETGAKTLLREQLGAPGPGLEHTCRHCIQASGKQRGQSGVRQAKNKVRGGWDGAPGPVL